jgi:hypothetical protein
MTMLVRGTAEQCDRGTPVPVPAGVTHPPQQVEDCVAGECGQLDAPEFERQLAQLGEGSDVHRPALAHALRPGHDARVHPVAERKSSVHLTQRSLIDPLRPLNPPSPRRRLPKYNGRLLIHIERRVLINVRCRQTVFALQCDCGCPSKNGG